MKLTIVTGFFLPVPPVAGGAVEKMWWRLARCYARHGHEVTLLSRQWPGWPDAETREGVRLLRLRGADHRARLWQNLLLDARWGLRVLRALPPADLLITNTVALPVFVRQLRPDAGRLVVNLNRHPKGQTRWYGRADRIQAASAAIATAVRQQSPARAAVVRVVPNSIAAHAFAGPPALRPPGAPVALGFFGRIHPEKGLERLVAAAALLARTPDLPPWRLVLRGPVEVPQGGAGPVFVARLRALAPALWADGRLALAPPLFDPAALAEAYRALEIFCYPTEAVAGEAHPVAVLEAMAAGCAVVATDLPCFADQLVAERNALLTPPGEASALAATLARLVRDPGLRHALGAQARRDISVLDDETVAAQHLADYASLLHAPARP